MRDFKKGNPNPTQASKFLLTFIGFLIFGFQHTASAQDQNYVRTRVPRTAVTDKLTLDANTNTPSLVQVSYKYVDVFGKQTQTVANQQSPSGKDVVQLTEYDLRGHPSKQWLPYTIANSTPGSYRLNGISETTTFYSLGSTVQGVALTSVPYSENNYEFTPNARLNSSGSPGVAWEINAGHAVTTNYTNFGSVKLWIPVASGASSSGNYNSEALTGVSVKDENGNIAKQFKDRNGNLVRKEIMTGSTTSLITDYIYDDANNLCYVIPPLPAGVIAPTSFTENDAVFINFCYAYHYDGKNRLIEKKVPGKGWEYFVYNKLDQVVLSRTPAQLSMGVWAYFKFDVAGRTVSTGTLPSSSTRNSFQIKVDSYSGPLFETFTNASANYGYTDNSYPDNTITASKKILTVSYYDTYLFLNNISINPNSAVFKEPVVDTLFKMPTGVLTGSLTNVLGAATPTYLLSVNHYDLQGRNVNTISQSFKSGATAAGNYDIVENQYAVISGLNTRNKRLHFIGGVQKLAVTSWNSYDLSGRKRVLKQQYNSDPAFTPAMYEYNEVGQLITKHLQSGSAIPVPATSSFMQHVDYRYNPRGWLTRINDPANLTDPLYGTQDLFAEQIDYDQPNSSYTGTTAQYNGNISTISWQTLYKPILSLTQEKKGYVLSYDALNRMTSSQFKSASGDNKYNEVLTYDNLGNILSLDRTNGSASSFINKLSYNYGTGAQQSNSLQSVTDNLGVENYTSTFSYLPSGSEYSNSKMLVSSITYNELNLPALINFTSGKKINLLYTATGTKLERIIKNGNTLLEDRSYISGIEYNTDDLPEAFYTETGRARPNGTGYTLEYSIADHLGNTRAVFGDLDHNGTFTTNDIVQITDYYAFGRQIPYLEDVNPKYSYKFGNKEYSEDLNAYDFGARYFNPVTARWNAVDDMADKSRRWSPYSYAYNNPVRNIDPDGNFSYDFSTAYANAVSTAVTVPQKVLDAQAQLIMWDSEDADYAAGKTNSPAARGYFSADLIMGVPSKEWTEYYNGNGPSGGSSLFYALNSDGDRGQKGGLGNFLVHLTPFGGIVDFANAAREGNVGGAVLGLASTASFFIGEGMLSKGVSGESSIAGENFAYRALRADEVSSVNAGNGIMAKAPNGQWTNEQHLIDGSSRQSWNNDPWIATTPNLGIARSFDSGHGVARIDLFQIPQSSQTQGWMNLPRSSPGYHFSVWQQEISINQSIPQSAITYPWK